MNNHHLSKTKKINKDLWRTPPQVFDYYNKRYNFKLDVCASEHNALCLDYLDEQYDSAKNGWDNLLSAGSYAWCNPPYSNVTPFIEQAIKAAKKGINTVMLLNCDCSTKWFLKADSSGYLASNEIITEGRLAFISEETGKPCRGNNKGQMVLTFGAANRKGTHYTPRSAFGL